MTGRSKCRDKPESQSRQERGHECARHDRPVQRHGKRHERRDQLQARPRQQQREEGSTDGQDQAFDDQLPDEPEPGRAERQTDRHLTAAPGGTHQEEVRGVDTGEHEHEKGNGQDDGDHLTASSSSLDRPDTSTLTRSTESSADATSRPAQGTCRTSDAEPPGNDAELGLDAVDADTVPHSAHVSNHASAGLPKRIVHRHTIHESDRQPEVDASPGCVPANPGGATPMTSKSLPSRLDRPSDH